MNTKPPSGETFVAVVLKWAIDLGLEKLLDLYCLSIMSVLSVGGLTCLVNFECNMEYVGNVGAVFAEEREPDKSQFPATLKKSAI